MADSQWTDRWTTEDQLGFEGYRKTLVNVILDADTPITTWGEVVLGVTIEVVRVVHFAADFLRRACVTFSVCVCSGLLDPLDFCPLTLCGFQIGRCLMKQM